jgi:mRNA interferase MazF
VNDRRSPLRGEIWQVALDPVVGHEQGGNRPAVVVSSNALNAGPSSLVIVVPLTRRDRGNPFNVPVEASERGVKNPSVALCDMVRSVSHERLSFRRGTVDAAALAEIEDRLLVLLDIG